MNIARCPAFLLLLLPLFFAGVRAQAADGPENPQPITDQIVRLSFVQGDVRIARGMAGRHATGGDWGQAQAELPIQTGFSLVTGTGRAEIELEDASTVYLGENSVLSFDLLADEGDVPHTVLTLVSGVATLHVTPAIKGETFVLSTPASRLALRHGASIFLRVHSYLDATRYVPLAPSALEIRSTHGTQGVQRSATQAVNYYTDGRTAEEAAPTPGSPADPMSAWDAWTIDRVQARNTAMAAALRDSGLHEPIPGLNQLEQSGRFFPCAPYGTCWAPNPPATARPAHLSLWPQRSAGPHLVLAADFLSAQYIDPGFDPYGSYGYLYGGYPFPCIPGGVTGIDWIPGQAFAPYNAIDGAAYDWALCHAGSWIQRNRGYVWVAGEHKHHRCPVRWVKYGGKTAFVPVHPRDEHGKPPLNLGHGVFLLSNKTTLRYASFAPGTPVKEMNDPPREFRTVYYPTLHSASAPQPVAHALEVHPAREGADGKLVALAASEPVHIGRHAEAFSVVHQEFTSGRSRTVTEHFGGSDGVARAASPGLSGIRGGFTAARGSSFSGGSSVARAAGASGGGASAGHGGGGGSAGGSHGGGGGGAGGAGGGHR